MCVMQTASHHLGESRDKQSVWAEIRSEQTPRRLTDCKWVTAVLWPEDSGRNNVKALYSHRLMTCSAVAHVCFFISYWKWWFSHPLDHGKCDWIKWRHIQVNDRQNSVWGFVRFLQCWPKETSASRPWCRGRVVDIWLKDRRVGSRLACSSG